MSYSDKEIRRLFARSMNQCAMPKCMAPIVIGETIVGEICHIRARRKNGPRFDPTLAARDRDAYPNLLLLCRTCHKLVDADPKVYCIDLLEEIKTIQDREGGNDLTAQGAAQAKALYTHLTVKSTRKVTAKSGDSGVSISIGGDSHAPITINNNIPRPPPSKPSKYPANSIGADANMGGYIEYLVDLAERYWANTAMTPARIGRKIKSYLRIGPKRTRLHAPVEKFEKLVEYLVEELLLPSPVGKHQKRLGNRVRSTFDEWRAGR